MKLLDEVHLLVTVNRKNQNVADLNRVGQVIQVPLSNAGGREQISDKNDKIQLVSLVIKS